MAKKLKTADIKQHMEVVGLDGKHVGTVDHLEGSDRIKLTKNDQQAAGRHHFVSLDAVQRVDDKVHLNKAAETIFLEWQLAA